MELLGMFSARRTISTAVLGVLAVATIALSGCEVQDASFEGETITVYVGRTPGSGGPEYALPDLSQPAAYDAARQTRLDGHDYEQPDQRQARPYETLAPMHAGYESGTDAARPTAGGGYETLGEHHAQESAPGGGGGYEAYSADEVAAAVAAVGGKPVARQYVALAEPHTVYAAAGKVGGVHDTTAMTTV